MHNGFYKGPTTPTYYRLDKVPPTKILRKTHRKKNFLLAGEIGY